MRKFLAVKPFCTMPGCENVQISTKMCRKHYAQYRASLPGAKSCEIENCDRVPQARGLCAQHYKNIRMRKKHGMSIIQREERLDAQERKCLACKQHISFQDDGSPMAQVDHDHACCAGAEGCEKCVRGIVCMRCNTVLGMIDDNVGILHALEAYLTGKAR